MDNLDLVIDHLEKEVKTLKQELEKCLAGFDYEGAHLFQKSIWVKSAEISVLINRREVNRKIINASRRRARMLNSNIENQEKWLLKYSEKSKEWKEDFEAELNFYKQKLDETNNTIIELSQNNKGNCIDEDILLTEIENLLDHKISMLCLEINEKEVDYEEYMSYISIINKKESIQIEFIENLDIQAERSAKKIFRQELGFQQNASFNYDLFLEKENLDPNFIHHIISVICFEVLMISGSANCKLMVR